jgi:uncharacterized protein (DUF952 family)
LPLIYKICQLELWLDAVEAGLFTGAAVDVADGFVHFSTAHQLEETLARHFTGQTSLVVAAFDAAVFGDALKWELSRGGDRFPHLHGTFSPPTALVVMPLETDADGGHRIDWIALNARICR